MVSAHLTSRLVMDPRVQAAKRYVRNGLATSECDPVASLTGPAHPTWAHQVAKRYTRNGFRCLSLTIMLPRRHPGPPNATYVHPARFCTPHLNAACDLDPSWATKRYVYNGFCVFHQISSEVAKRYTHTHTSFGISRRAWPVWLGVSGRQTVCT